MKVTHDPGICPETQILSEIYDGECHDKTVLDHVKNCSRCTEYLAGLSALDRELHKSLDKITPDNIAKRCLTLLHRRLDREKNNTGKQHFLSYGTILLLARAASAAVLISLVVFLAWRSFSRTGKAPAKTIQFSGKIASSAVVKASLSPSEEPHASGLSAVIFRDEAASGKGSGKYLEIPSKVSHIWTSVRSAGALEGQKRLSEILRKNNIFSAVIPDNHSFRVDFDTTKGRCAAFVRACKAGGFLLKTPVQPQPEQKFFLGKSSDKVHYHALFVTGK